MKKPSTNQLFAGIVSIAVIAAVLGGMFIAGSPTQERLRRTDEQRVSDLQQVYYAVDSYMKTNGNLPTSLDALARSPDVYVQRITDPATNAPYIYRPGTEGRYTLCATFETESNSGPDQPLTPQTPRFWEHRVGETCFALQATTDVSGMKPMPIVR